MAAHRSEVLCSCEKENTKRDVPLVSLVKISVEQELESGRRGSQSYAVGGKVPSAYEIRKDITVLIGISTWNERRSAL